MQICRGGAPVPALRGIGQPRGDCPYKNYANDLGSLYSLIMSKNRRLKKVQIKQKVLNVTAGGLD